MAGKLKDVVLEDVKALIRNLTGFEDDDNNFKACERYIMSNLVHHRYLSVDSHAIRRSLDGITTKFNVHGLTRRGCEFERLVQAFLACDDYKNHGTTDIQWALLSFVLHVAQNPTCTVECEVAAEDSFDAPVIQEKSPEFDWAAYLREGEEEFQRDWNEKSDSEDEVDRCASPSVQILLHKGATPCRTPSYTPPASPAAHCEVPPHHQQNIQSDNKHKNTQWAKFAESEKWLKDHVQNSWWSDPDYKEELSTNNPSSRLVELWEKDEKSGVKVKTLSEHKVVLEILWFLSVPSSSALFMKVFSKKEQKWILSVRSHVSVSSLTCDVFMALLNKVCSYGVIVDQLELFCKDVFQGETYKVASHTYQAYSNALQEELTGLKKYATDMELCAHKQVKSHTLLETMDKLTPWFQKLDDLYTLHQRGVLDWRKHPNWLCAAHLLSVQLAALRCGQGNLQIVFRIFLRTFSAYIHIADEWLTKGLLFDWRHEFLITSCEKDSEKGILGAIFVKHEWEKELKARNVESPALLQILAQCLLQAARPLHVLQQMERLAELRRRNNSKSSLCTRFLESMIKQLENFKSPIFHFVSSEPESSIEDLSWKQLDYCLLSKEDSKEGKNIPVRNSLGPSAGSDVVTYLRRLEDPFLEEAFKGMLSFEAPVSLKVGDAAIQEHMNEEELFQRLIYLRNTLKEFVPLESCLESAVYQLSTDWEGVAGSMVADILVREQRLLHHLHFAQSVYLLQSIYKLQPFIFHFFSVVMQTGDGALANSHSLSVLLQDCMDADQFSVTLQFSDKDPSDMSVLKAIDCLCVHYEVEWPVSAIIGKKYEESYNAIFRLLLKLRWGVWMLEGLNFTKILSHSDHPIIQRLLYLRFWLLHVVRGSYSFFAGHILNSLMLQFEEDIRCAKDLHAIVKLHEKFIETSLHQCLQAGEQDYVKNALFQLIVLADKLREMWCGGPSKVPTDSLTNIEECFLRYHGFLATVLRIMSEEDGQHHLGYLSDVFSYSTPRSKE